MYMGNCNQCSKKFPPQRISLFHAHFIPLITQLTKSNDLLAMM